MDKIPNIKIEIANTQECLDIRAKSIECVIKKALLDYCSTDLPFEGCPKYLRSKELDDSFVQTISEASISIAIVDNSTIRLLKKEFLDIDEVTDVLAFPLSDTEQIKRGHLEGEIVVSAEKALEEASRRKLDPQAELCLYVVHGTLHLLGYDDHDSDMAAVMYQKEEEILSWIGYDNVR